MELIDSLAFGKVPSALRKGACQGRRWLRGSVSLQYVLTVWNAIWLKVYTAVGQRRGETPKSAIERNKQCLTRMEWWASGAFD
jgi:hypothetical protein